MLHELFDMLKAPMRKRLAAWDAFAQSRGGRLNPPSGSFLSYRGPSIDVPYRDALVHIDSYTQKNGETSTTYTRFRASFLLPSGPTFKVYKENFLSPIGRLFGFQDIELGDAAFDRKYIVRTNSPTAAQRAWTPKAMTALQRLDRGTARSDGHVVKFTTTGLQKDPHILGLGVDLVGELAHYARDWLGVLEALPNARYVRPQGEWDERWAPSVSLPSRVGGEVRVFPLLHETRTTFCAATPPARELPVFRLAFGADGSPLSEVPDDLLAPEARRLLSKAAPGELSCDGHYVRYLYLGAPNSQGIEAGVRLLEAVAGGSTRRGAFR